MPDKGQDNTTQLLTEMLCEAWEYLQDAKRSRSREDIATWREAIDVLLDSPQVARAPL